ncbi:hypothetical protein KIH41_05790 [Litoribacter ruber]|uniref:Uncharacterized protein n=1 Tax=Litoribacter ruber TaxID=702568 RepID=A0AAP2CJR2_9BACT|nr:MULTISPECIES: hypothetical protein [Litoribacter]MBS9523047.1 hypothetical protein [Litoribacter alkaliphilus]MBT0810789.1 hypothetical protein [Litoribacter ruber]
MKFFYIDENLSDSGVKKIHAQGCAQMPDMMNRRYLGPFNNSEEALRRVAPLEPTAEICSVCGK